MTTESGFAALINDSANQNLSSLMVDLNGTATSIAVMDSHELSWIPLSLLLASALLSHSGIRLLPWMLIGEVFPAKIRGISSGLAGGTSYVFGFLANKLFLTMVEGLTLAGTFLLYSCISCCGCIILFFILPGLISNFYSSLKLKILFVLETESRTLQEIEDHFNGKQKLPRSMKQKAPVQAEPFPVKFDVAHWESNEKFEKSLQQHHIVLQPHHVSNGNLQPRRVNQQAKPKLANEGNKRQPKVCVNDADYDTPL